MINTDMRQYGYILVEHNSLYGEDFIPTSAEPIGYIKMAIYTTNQTIQDNVNYSGAQYIGLTQDEVKDTYIIMNGKERLKVLYVNARGRLKQVFMERAAA